MRKQIALFIMVASLFGVYSLFRETPSVERQSSELVSVTHSTPALPSPYEPPQATPQTITPTVVRDSESTPPVEKPFHYFSNRFVYLEQCLQRRCRFPDTDPKSYDDAVFSEMEDTVSTFRKWQKRHQVQDKRVVTMMTRLLRHRRSELQTNALEILGTQKKSDKVPTAILKHVIESPLPEPIPAAMRELARYKNGRYQRQIETTLYNTLTHGPVHSAVEVARHVPKILTTSNRKLFAKALDELSEQPLAREIHATLKTSLDYE